MSVSYIPGKTKMLLWGKAAGRCQYKGCNKCLYEDGLTKAEFNSAYIAHIVADKPDGPRGDVVRSEQLKRSLSNLMLMCDVHHRMIDKVDVAGHPESMLLAMKKAHEERMALVSGISEDMESEMVIYKANVGKHSPVLTYEALSSSLLPTHYPAQKHAIDLGLTNSTFRDKDASFWAVEEKNLVTQFNEQIRPKLRLGNATHFSIFAFAPMPLLMKLGVLINDIQRVELYQPVRTPTTWKLSDELSDIKYVIRRPRKKYAKVALNISLSATIDNKRITNVLGDDCSIYTITIKDPFNDFLKTKKALDGFSIAIRKLFDTIKAKYNAQTPLHIFPAMPIATAIELGRVWMPKADMPLVIYDENTANSGFCEALQIINK